MRFLPRRRPRPPAAAREVVESLSWRDLDAGRRRMTVDVDLPDTFVASAPADHTVAAHEMVRDLVARALSARALDEHVPDVADARIDTAREVWDAAAVPESDARARTAAQLYAIELENLAFVEQTVADGRREVARLTAAVEGWRAVLLGYAEHAPDVREQAAAAVDARAVAPRQVELGSPVHALLTAATSTGADRSPQVAGVELAAVDGHSTRSTHPAPSAPPKESLR